MLAAWTMDKIFTHPAIEEEEVAMPDLEYDTNDEYAKKHSGGET